MTTAQRIDPHDCQRKLEIALRDLENRPHGITPGNAQLIRKFCNDCILGKTVLRGGKRRIGPARTLGYLGELIAIAYWLGKDFDQVTQEEMEEFITKLETDQLHYFVQEQPRRKTPPPRRLTPRHYTPLTKFAFKASLKKFYKWLLGRNEVYPPLVSWIDANLGVCSLHSSRAGAWRTRWPRSSCETRHSCVNSWHRC